MGVNPLTGKSLWKMHSVYPLAAAPPDKDADSQNFGLLAYGTHSIAASLLSLIHILIRCIDEISEQVRRVLGLSLTTAQIECVLRGQDR